MNCTSEEENFQIRERTQDLKPCILLGLDREIRYELKKKGKGKKDPPPHLKPLFCFLSNIQRQKNEQIICRLLYIFRPRKLRNFTLNRLIIVVFYTEKQWNIIKNQVYDSRAPRVTTCRKTNLLFSGSVCRGDRENEFSPTTTRRNFGGASAPRQMARG